MVFQPYPGLLCFQPYPGLFSHIMVESTTALASYDLSHPQAASKGVTSHAGRCTVSSCLWRSRHIEKRLTGVRARTERQSCETRGSHTTERRQSNRGPYHSVQNGGKKHIQGGLTTAAT